MPIEIKSAGNGIEGETLERQKAPEKFSAEGIKKEEISQNEVAGIKNQDALETGAARKELENFDAQNGQEAAEKTKFLALAAQKIEEMQAELDKKKKGFFNKFLYSEKQITEAQEIIKKTKADIADGRLPDMHSVQNRIGIVNDVNLDGLPERKGKQYADNRHNFGQGA